jgi:H+/Cl- antiporter ClcA
VHLNRVAFQYCPRVTTEPTGDADDGRTVATALHSPGYLKLLLLAGVIGVPLSFVAFGFLAAVHELEHLVWHTLPSDAGYDHAPAWWPVLALGSAGVLVGLTVRYLPGHGGHVPAAGLGGGVTPPSHLPGVVLASGASLVLGAVVGPEAPLIAMGSGLALLAVRRTAASGDVQASSVFAAAGSAAAISAIFGNPLIAAVLMLEVLGLARRQAMLVVLPCLVSSGVGALVFTGLGDWTGLGIGALSLPGLDLTRLDGAEVAWAVPLAAVVAVLTWPVFEVGRRTAALAKVRVLRVTVAAGLVAGGSAAAYTLVTDHSPDEVALSGQATLAVLASDPGAWSTGALVMLVACKGLAYALSIGVFRGGPVFPAIFLGAAVGAVAATWLPGLELTPALAIGMAAGVATTGLPVTSALLVVLLLGDSAVNQMPVVLLAVVTALIVEEKLRSLRPARPTADHVG